MTVTHYRKYIEEEVPDELTKQEFRQKPFLLPFLERGLFDPEDGSDTAGTNTIMVRKQLLI